jgi:hypothetical protein
MDPQVVVDDVERRGIDPRDVEPHRLLRVHERDAELLELAELALGRLRDVLDNSSAGIEHRLDRRPACSCARSRLDGSSLGSAADCVFASAREDEFSGHSSPSALTLNGDSFSKILKAVSRKRLRLAPASARTASRLIT